MNRRGFITGLVSSFFVLPSATTYARNWIKTSENLYIPNSNYVSAPYSCYVLSVRNQIEVGPPPTFVDINKLWDGAIKCK